MTHRLHVNGQRSGRVQHRPGRRHRLPACAFGCWIALLAFPAAIQAQAGPLRLEGVEGSVTAPVDLAFGYAAHPASALAALGATLDRGPLGGTVALFGDTLAFETLSPFFLAGSDVFQLAFPVYEAEGSLYLPRQLFTEWLPNRFPGRLSYENGTLRLRPEGAGARLPEQPDDRSRPSPTARPTAPGPRPDGDRVVVIDPGHGGRDPGKIGPGGIREKDVTLSAGLRLAELLRQRGYEVHLTRTGDEYVPLLERPKLANQWKAGRPAALFLSLHANSSQPSARGFETFFLSEARTEDERRVAEMENAALQYDAGPSGDLPGTDFILRNLQNNYYQWASYDLAEVVQRHLANMHPGPNRGVKQAGFLVLVGALMPAVLVELAFISDTREARLLASRDFQTELAAAVADAVDEFFDANDWGQERVP